MSTPSDPLVALTALKRRIHLFKRIVPIGLILLVALYELGPARWILEHAGEDYHLLVDILVYAIVGPILAYLPLHFLERWLEERETSELQARLLAHTRELARISHEISDDALQALFGASVMLATLKASLPDMPPNTASALRQTEAALDRAIQQIRDHLENQPPPQVLPGKE